jgi:WD40 repeat protein
VFSLAISPDNTLVLAGMFDGSICMWYVPTGQLLGRFRDHTIRVTSISFRPDGQVFVSGSWDNTLKFWKVDFNVVRKMTDGLLSVGATTRSKSCAKCILTRPGEGCVQTSVSISPDGQWIATTNAHDVMFWDKHGEKQLRLKEYSRRKFNSHVCK